MTASVTVQITHFCCLFPVKRNLDLKDFTFSQNSLEQTFLDFAREQREGDSRYSSVKDIKSHSALSHTSRDQDRKSTDTTVDMSTVDTAPQPRDAQDEGGASCQDAVSDAADAAVGVVTVHVNGDDNGGGVAGVRGGGHTDAGAAAPVVFSIDGVDNLAYMPDTDDAHDQQMTSLWRHGVSWLPVQFTGLEYQWGVNSGCGMMWKGGVWLVMYSAFRATIVYHSYTLKQWRARYLAHQCSAA